MNGESRTAFRPWRLSANTGNAAEGERRGIGQVWERVWPRRVGLPVVMGLAALGVILPDTAHAADDGLVSQTDTPIDGDAAKSASTGGSDPDTTGPAEVEGAEPGTPDPGGTGCEPMFATSHPDDAAADESSECDEPTTDVTEPVDPELDDTDTTGTGPVIDVGETDSTQADDPASDDPAVVAGDVADQGSDDESNAAVASDEVDHLDVPHAPDGTVIDEDDDLGDPKIFDEGGFVGTADTDFSETDPDDVGVAVDEPAPRADPAVVEPAATNVVTTQPVDSTTGPSEPDTGLIATSYDGVYANGVPVGVAMATTRFLESRGNYRAEAAGSTASGAYQVIDSTWNDYAGYERASDAPPEIQDQFAYESFVALLKRHGNDVSKIPVAWYFPIALRSEVLMDIVPAPHAGNTLTVREYQTRWMEKFYELLGEGAPVFLPADTDPLVPAIAFPVLGPVSFVNDWHFVRAGGARVHEGLDLLGSYGQPLRAAFDGEIVRIVSIDRGISGVSLEIRREDGLRAIYRHMNNDTPGTTDNSAIEAFRIHPGLTQGSIVRAGQIVGYMGDTGNAVGVPHLHFELRHDDRTPFAPYPAILEAQQREQCSVGIGPWSTAFRSPTETATRFDELKQMTRSELDDVATDELALLEPKQLRELDGLSLFRRIEARLYAPPTPFLISGDGGDGDDRRDDGDDGDDGAWWRIAADGAVSARGPGALTTPEQGECSVVPDPATWYGSDAAGLAIELLPDGWWGDEPEQTMVRMSPRAADHLAEVLAEEDGSFAGIDDFGISALRGPLA